jgi:hypothetical protein
MLRCALAHEMQSHSVICNSRHLRLYRSASIRYSVYLVDMSSFPLACATNLSSTQHQLSHLVDNSSTRLIEGSYRRYSKMEHTGVLHVIIGVTRGGHDAIFHYCTPTYYMRLRAGSYSTSLVDLTTCRAYLQHFAPSNTDWFPLPIPSSPSTLAEASLPRKSIHLSSSSLRRHFSTNYWSRR